jgi:fructose-1,6-bisphosphatase/inositol monophosphatase family enzyme
MDLDERAIAAIIEAVRRVAKAEVMPRFRNLDPSEIGTKSGPNDLVTIADRLAEAAVTEAMGAILPGATVIGEEAVAENPALLARIGEAESCVILDPIDGTGNYAAGIAVFGMILAVVHRGRTVFGLLYDPVLDDWVAATRSRGAWYQRPGGAPRALRTRPAPDFTRALGFLAPSVYAPAERAALLAAFSPVEQLRFLRCSCHEYRQIATGQADFIVSPGLRPWDHAAGVLVLEMAGGLVLVDGTARYSPTMTEGQLVAAGAPELMAELHRRAVPRRRPVPATAS